MAKLAAAQQSVVDRVAADHPREDRPARGRVRCGGRQPDRELARASARRPPGRGRPQGPWRARARHAHLHRGDSHDRPRLRQHRDDPAHAFHGNALHRRARHAGAEAPLLPRGGRARPALRKLGQRAGREPVAHLPDGDGGHAGRRRLRRERGEVLLHDGARRLALHGLVRARRRDRHGQVPAPGPGARRRARHRHRRQVGHARHARDVQPVGHLHGRPRAERGRPRRPGRSHPRRRRRRLRARLCRRVSRHCRGLARLRHRLREEARRQAGERLGGPRSDRAAPRRATCPPIWTPHCWCWRGPPRPGTPPT